VSNLINRLPKELLCQRCHSPEMSINCTATCGLLHQCVDVNCPACGERIESAWAFGSDYFDDPHKCQVPDDPRVRQALGYA
jgi:hypothetical protein